MCGFVVVVVAAMTYLHHTDLHPTTGGEDEDEDGEYDGCVFENADAAADAGGRGRGVGT